jgi:hypothetical protein
VNEHDELPLDYQLQTLGEARSSDFMALYEAALRMNAQNVRLVYMDGVYSMTCTPQPQDCGPLPT